MAKISISIDLDHAIDFDKFRNDILRALKVTSDYQHDNIVMFYDTDKQEIEIDAFPSDFRDIAHSRTALKHTFDVTQEVFL